MKEYIFVMKEEQTQLRKMIADCLRFFKKQDGYWITRDCIEVHEDRLDTTYSGISLENLIAGFNPKDYKNIFVRGDSYKDYEYGDGSQVLIYSLRKQTDQEYFDTICSYILPTEHQWKQYQEYLRLKKQFRE